MLLSPHLHRHGNLDLPIDGTSYCENRFVFVAEEMSTTAGLEEHPVSKRLLETGCFMSSVKMKEVRLTLDFSYRKVTLRDDTQLL